MHFSSKSLAAIIALASCCHQISGATNNISSRRRISDSKGFQLFQKKTTAQQYTMTNYRIIERIA